jgi:hypothetical protein
MRGRHSICMVRSPKFDAMWARGENYSVSLEGNSKLGVLSVFLLNTVTLGIFQGLVVVHDIRPV